ncbi:MAG: DUF2203 domain-containing protein [Phycisphaerae bacterium]|nr:DUF2203 domain-containing protein [Phycisphaerae bacterium]
MEAFGTTAIARKSRHLRGRKIFTLAQANRTLPLVSRIVADIVARHKQICRIEERCHADDHDHSMEQLDRLRDQYADELDALQDLIEELEQIGCQLKDWERGVVDYLAFINGRPVEFCWRLGEPRIAHWHEMDSGFRGRQKLDQCMEADAPAGS